MVWLPRYLYTVIDYTLLEVLKEEPVRVTIKGLRRTFYPPIHHAPVDNTPPEKKMQLEWMQQRVNLKFLVKLGKIFTEA
ncbi:hypothetical protein NQ318_017994 [Aromia moschata]|uniref:Uncharacterized protein n=1 Tax=Aromia moschata TaxID=1265417 RepID=A0AAV8Y9Q3_9CUCU|nr:hypothetical protein NQ318_017994 [Aromia moschata]